MSREPMPDATEVTPVVEGADIGGDARALPRPLDHVGRDRTVMLVALLVIWEGAIRTGIIDPFFAAAPTQIAAAMIELATLPEIRQAFVETLAMVGAAFGIASVAGILVGAWLGLSRWAYRAFHPIVALGMSTPKMIFLPLMIVIFGIGFSSKVAYGVLSAIFFITINVTAGVRMVDDHLLTVVRSMGASRWERFRFVVLPGSLPGIAVGLWYGIKHALLGVLIAELFVSIHGIGFWINRYTAGLHVDRVYAVVVSLAIVAITLGWIWKRVDEHMNRWRVSI